MTIREKNALVVVSAFLAAAGIISVGFVPAVESYRTARLARLARQQEVKNLEERKQVLIDLSAQLGEFQTELSTLALAAPDTPQFPELLVQVTTMAERASLLLSSVQPVRAAKGGQEVVLALAVRGSFPDIVRFAELLEVNLRPASVKTLAMVKGSKEDNLSATLTVSFVKVKAASTTQGAAQ